MSSTDRTGRVGLIAGGTRGIGHALTAALARHWEAGDHVYLTARKAEDGVRATAAIEGARAALDWLPLNLRDPGSIVRLAATLRERHGGVDVAVMNGGFAPAHDAPPARDARPMIETNNHGALVFLRAFAPLMRENGRLVIVASGLGRLQNLPEALRPRFDTRLRSAEEIDRAMADYVAGAESGRLEEEGWPAWINIPSKVGQVAVTRAFAKTYAASADHRPGVLINAGCPGLTLTDATVGLMDNVFKGRSAQTPEEGAAHLLRLATLPLGTTSPYAELVQQGKVLAFGD